MVSMCPFIDILSITCITSNFCCLLVTIANSLEPSPAKSGSKWFEILKAFFPKIVKKNADDKKERALGCSPQSWHIR